MYIIILWNLFKPGLFSKTVQSIIRDKSMPIIGSGIRKFYTINGLYVLQLDIHKV